MTSLRIEDFFIPSASLGEENLMPDIKNVTYIHATFNLSDSINEDERKYIGKGKAYTILPYLLRDGYNRNLNNKCYKSVVLENEYLKAIFLPELGGRLWSLFDKKNNRELLYVNKIFQPGNLGIRNAWFSGGIEFNVGIRGHNPLTCEPMFTAFSKDDNGNDVLSLYEFERIRGLVYSINARLIKNRLFLTTTIENLNNDERYMYWWTNIAVKENGSRVYVPSNKAFVVEYGDDKYRLTKKSMPFIDGIDSSYPENFNHSGDLFYDIEDNNKKWESVIEKDGYGLLEYSTNELRGRKVFFWGNNTGGKRWNEFLSNDKTKYIEIQAGYLKTQMEHIPMPGNTTWTWTDVYRSIEIPSHVLNKEWNIGNDYINSIVNDEYDLNDIDFSIPKNKKIVLFGSGWGAFENGIRKISDIFEFPIESLTSLQDDFLDLFKNGYIKYRNKSEFPKSYYVSNKTLELLNNSTKDKGNHYLTYLYIGINKYANKDIEGALQAFNISNKLEENVLAYRNISMIYKNELNDNEKAKENIIKAFNLLEKENISFYKDLGYILTSCNGDVEYLNICDIINKEYSKNGRIGLYKVIALMHLGRFFEASEILNENFEMNDIKEGEISVSSIWTKLYSEISKLGGTNKKLPDKLDFRMV